ncbi:MAG: YceI family protein [Limisphaerales bacterium]
MKTNRPSQLLSLSAAWLCLAGAAAAQNLVRFESQPGSKMRMDGTSTIHDWHAESQLIGGFLELDAALVDAPDKVKAGKVGAKGETFVAVRSLKCSSGKAMDAVMQEAMKEKENPRITFKLVELSLKEAKGANVNFEAKGSLTVSGVTKDITFPVTMARRVDTSRITFSGTTAMKMTDFKITPPAPTAAVGLIKTGDEVKLTFEWAVAKKEAGK